MKTETRIFGTIDIADEKIITMPKGMIGFPDLQKFTLIFDEDKNDKGESIMWLQSMDDGDIAFPVITPNLVKDDYTPNVSEELLSPLGEMKDEDVYMLVTVTVPKEITKMTCNLQAPIIINMDNNKAVQIIVDLDYPIRFPIFDILKGRKDGE